LRGHCLFFGRRGREGRRQEREEERARQERLRQPAPQGRRDEAEGALHGRARASEAAVSYSRFSDSARLGWLLWAGQAGGERAKAEARALLVLGRASVDKWCGIDVMDGASMNGATVEDSLFQGPFSFSEVWIALSPSL